MPSVRTEAGKKCTPFEEDFLTLIQHFHFYLIGARWHLTAGEGEKGHVIAGCQCAHNKSGDSVTKNDGKGSSSDTALVCPTIL